MNNMCKECELYDGCDGKYHEDWHLNCNMFRKSAKNAVDPDHYKHGGIECKDCIKAALGENYIGFLLGNVIKYIYRYKGKNGADDLKKAAVYLGWAIQELEVNGNDV